MRWSLNPLKRWKSYLDVSKVKVVHDVGHQDVLQESHVLVVVAAEERMSPETQKENIWSWLQQNFLITCLQEA